MTDDEQRLDLGVEPPRRRRATPAVANLARRPWRLADLLRHSGVDIATMAEVLKVDQTTVWRRQEWGLTDQEADEWAVALGLHPGQVWGVAWFESALYGNEQGDLFG